ncbi:uncharacterized protein LOC109917153 [Rhincodon typus]|uniref:uncharacterized protein LOC109917153 n=1 Tax=Rhincodon typus TaxID=259920 RepID=UPI00203033B2|nr:uncharacterized protein LOC109917153 [Rhincodon typus]
MDLEKNSQAFPQDGFVLRVPLERKKHEMTNLVGGKFCFCSTLQLLFRKCKWPEKASVEPTYRKLHKVYNFDDYSSKGAAVITIKKFHPSLSFKEQTAGNENNEEGGDDSVLKNHEFWDYEKQIDLESFNANTFYQILLKQSLAVSIRLSQYKNEVKTLYQKIDKETASLRELWMERMHFAGRAVVSNNKDMEMYEKMCLKIRTEIERQKHIGMEFEEVLNRQLQLLLSDWSCREEHHISFNTVLREAVRLVNENIVNSKRHKILPGTRVAEQFEALILQMSDVITSECQRLNTWALLGDGTGTQLISKNTSKALSKEELIGADGTIRACDLQLDQLTGLVTPCPDTVMLLANKYFMYVPEGYFLHPQTGRVLPIAGNVCYDSTKSKLISLTDSSGMVVPLGGVTESSNTPLIIGDSFLEPLS